MSCALNLPHSVANICEPRPVVHRRGRSRALAHPSGPLSEHDGFSSCDHRDLKAASRTSRTALLALQVSAEQSVGWMTAMPSSPPIRPIQIGPQEAAKTLTDDCSALSWTQELGLTCLESGRRAASNETSCFSRRFGPIVLRDKNVIYPAYCENNRYFSGSTVAATIALSKQHQQQQPLELPPPFPLPGTC